MMLVAEGSVVVEEYLSSIGVSSKRSVSWKAHLHNQALSQA